MEDLLLLEYYCALSTIYKFYCINSVEARLRARVDVSFSPRPPDLPIAKSTEAISKRERDTHAHTGSERCEKEEGRKVRKQNRENVPPSAGDCTINARSAYIPRREDRIARILVGCQRYRLYLDVNLKLLERGVRSRPYRRLTIQEHARRLSHRRTVGPKLVSVGKTSSLSCRLFCAIK